MKFNLKQELLLILAIVATVIFSFYLFANAPDQVPTHWNFAGEVDDYSSKTFGVVFFPSLILGVYLLFWFLPKIDPKKDKYAKFSKVYSIFKTVIVLFFVFMYFVSGLAALGHNINVGKIVPVGVGLLMIILGNYMGKIKPNWFVGIKTPWTLSSDKVWQRTHRLGGFMFVLLGLFFISSIFFAQTGIYQFLFLVTLAITILVPIVYSYLLYKKEKK